MLHEALQGKCSIHYRLVCHYEKNVSSWEKNLVITETEQILLTLSQKSNVHPQAMWCLQPSNGSSSRNGVKCRSEKMCERGTERKNCSDYGNPHKQVPICGWPACETWVYGKRSMFLVPEDADVECWHAGAVWLQLVASFTCSWDILVRDTGISTQF